MRSTAIIGIGITNFGRQAEHSVRDLAGAAALAAMEDAGCDRLDAIWVASAASGLLAGQAQLAPLVADHLGQSPVVVGTVENAGASGALALRAAWLEVASGQADCALAVGVEKVSAASAELVEDAEAAMLDREREAEVGGSPAALFAMMARQHMERFGSTRDQLSAIAHKNYTNAIHAEYALNRLRVTPEDLANSPPLADPLHALDAAVSTDGAAAVIVAAADRAPARADRGRIVVSGIGVGTDRMALHERDDLAALGATRVAAERAYRAAGVTPRQIDLAEVHDSFTIAELCATEALGFFEPGQGGPAAIGGMTAIEGDLPINASGGLLGRGDPFGATGLAQIVLLARQLRHEAGPLQVPKARRALAQSLGGSGASSVVTILTAEE